MSHQHNCSDRIAFSSCRPHSVALKICYSHTPESCCFSVTFSPLASLLCVTVFQSNGFVTCQGEFLDALEGTSSSSSEYLEIWLRILPLEKLLAFVWDKIPLFYDTWDTFPPQQFAGLSWGNCQVWRFCKCLEGFYFTAERQFDGLVQKELRFTQLDCLFWLIFFSYARSKRRLYC